MLYIFFLEGRRAIGSAVQATIFCYELGLDQRAFYSSYPISLSLVVYTNLYHGIFSQFAVKISCCYIVMAYVVPSYPSST
jgi:hypothetical protein